VGGMDCERDAVESAADGPTCSSSSFTDCFWAWARKCCRYSSRIQEIKSYAEVKDKRRPCEDLTLFYTLSRLLSAIGILRCRDRAHFDFGSPGIVGKKMTPSSLLSSINYLLMTCFRDPGQNDQLRDSRLRVIRKSRVN
jgi:hypothetical protein